MLFFSIFGTRNVRKVEKTCKSVSRCPILLGSVKHTQWLPCLQYRNLVWCLFMYTISYTTYITFYKMRSKGHLSYVAYICYVEGCKFSTSTHINYHIVQNIVSAIFEYFYGSWGPPGRSEIVYIVKKVRKLHNPSRLVCRVTYFRDISRK